MNLSSRRKSTTPPAFKTRIDWIDVAKGIAILLVIIGHTLKTGTFWRHTIFSFHMPLFFILSGYTYTPATDPKALWKHMKNHFRCLMWPCLAVSLFLVAYSVVKSDSYTFSEVGMQLWKMCQKLFYASGVPFHGVQAGMVWFIFSLFWTKIFIDVIYTFQKNGYKYCTIGCLAFLGVCLGSTRHWLVQNLDVTLVALVFFYVGMLWKKYSKQVEAYAPILFGASLAIWSVLVSYGIYIEMAGRRYPMYSVCMIEAIAASFVVCMFCKNGLDYKWIKRPLMVLGADSIILFYLHHCDWILKSFWSVKGNIPETACRRVLFILAIYLLIVLLRNLKSRIWSRL